MASDFGVDIRIDRHSNIAIITASGRIGFDTFSHALHELIATEGFYRKMNSVVDLRHARICSDASELGRVSDLYLTNQIERGHGFRMALLSGDDFSFGICRMIAVELEQVPIWARVVRNKEDALIWVAETENFISEREIG